MSLSNACAANNYYQVEQLLCNGANPEYIDEFGKTPLHYACIVNNYNIVKLLIAYDVDVNKKDYKYNSPLYYTTNVEIIKYLITACDIYNVNIKNIANKYILEYFCSNGDLDTVIMLCNRGANVRDIMIDCATIGDNLNILQYFLTKYNIKMYRSIEIAIQYGYIDILDFLLTLPEAHTCDDLLTFACANNIKNIDVIDKILQMDKNVNIINSKRESPIKFAIKQNSLDVVKRLIVHGLNFNNKNCYITCYDDRYCIFLTPLIYSYTRKKFDIFWFLFDLGCDVSDGELLNTVCNYNDTNIILKLLKKKADVNYVNELEESALMNICKYNNPSIVKKLLKCGANINHYDSRRITPLINACKYDNLEIATLLLEFGAKVDIKYKDTHQPILWLSDATHEEIIKFISKEWYQLCSL